MKKRRINILKPTNLLFPVVSVSSDEMPLPKLTSKVIPNMRVPSAMRLCFEIESGQAPYVFVVMPKPGMMQDMDRFYRIGMICSTAMEGNKQVAFNGEYRAEAISSFTWKDASPDSYFVAAVKPVEDKNTDAIFTDPRFQERMQSDLVKISHLLRRLYTEGLDVWDFSDDIMDGFEACDFGDKDEVDHLVWLSIASIPDIPPEEKQLFLESASISERITMLARLLEMEIASLADYKRKDKKGKDGGQSGSGADESDDEDKFFEEVHPDIKKAWGRFKRIRNFMSEDAKVVAREDIDQLISLGSPKTNSYEWPKHYRHLNFILDLPWDRQTKEESDIIKVAQFLEEDHYGLIHVKEKICDSIAPKLLNPTGRGQIICFVGPSGVGKTSLAKSIARALGRKLIRISVGGIRDETQIRGHDFTYIGSQPGEILREIKRCGVKNPVFVIDEIDKMGRYSVTGDPSSAMLEVLDPEQNHSFKDRYTGCSFDLSKVIFIATANSEGSIIPPLHDRMDIIRLSGYLEVEKIEIARRYLIPRWMEEIGLTNNNVAVSWDDEVTPLLIRGYTSEAGVRDLDRNIAAVLRKIARRYLKLRNENEAANSFHVDSQMINEFLGPVKFFKNKVRPTKIGEAVGLAWTIAGGEILYVQAEMYSRFRDTKVLTRTGMQGKIMEESDEVAMTLLRSELGRVNPEISEKFQDCSVHLHIPEGAVPKDGPSAGIAIFIALFSEITGQAVKPNLAMTGEIDIKGSIMPVGGIREKVVAAERAGIMEVILPKENERNIFDVPDSVKQNLRFHFLESVQEAIDVAFEKPE